MASDPLEARTDELLREAGAGKLGAEYPAHSEKYLQHRETVHHREVSLDTGGFDGTPIERAVQLRFIIGYSAPEINAIAMRANLTSRQLDILNWRRRGKTWAGVAEIMGCSERTVYGDVLDMRERLYMCRGSGLIAVLVAEFGWQAVADALGL
jgi:DNA-binding CsgD family transcriptional regulator